jgi:diguanylate cyclase (GGDEF)-like protein
MAYPTTEDNSANASAKQPDQNEVTPLLYPMDSFPYEKQPVALVDETSLQTQLAINALNDGIVVLDTRGEIIVSNRFWREVVAPDMFPLPGSHEESNYHELWARYASDGFTNDAHTISRGIRNVISDFQEFFRHEFTVPSMHEKKWYCAEITRFRHEGAVHIVVNHRDITTFKQAEREIEWLAYHDTLTGLPNRHLFDDRLEQSLAKADRNNGNVALLFFDLDSFKAINDTLGHSCGDMLLKAVAERLAHRIRKSDTLARYGGDEFVVILNDYDEHSHVATVTRAMLDTLCHPFTIDGEDLFISASVGIAHYPTDSARAGELLNNADIAMYHAKKRGGNSFLAYQPEMNRKTYRRLKWETALRRALENQELSLNYQPYLDITTGRLAGMEALLRWQHPGVGAVAPAQFIPVAEETGLIIPIGEWVLHNACRQARSLHDLGFEDIRIAVNVSGRQFLHYDLADLVASVLAENNIPPGSLELEITESTIMENSQPTIRTLKKLKSMGVFLTLDDFGTGYSSLSYLKRFPIDKIKIDRSFIRDIPVDKESMALTRAIIAMAHSLNLDVTAEGVENAEQLNFVISHGCTTVQGYHISHPLTVPDMLAYLHERRIIEKSNYMFHI